MCPNVGLSRALADMVNDGLDAGIRLRDTTPEDMIAIRLLPPFKAIMAAAPTGDQRWSQRCTSIAEAGA